jgi:hypothetical protein
MCIFVGLQAIYEIESNQKYICCFIRVNHAIKLCLLETLETEEFFELIQLILELRDELIK